MNRRPFAGALAPLLALGLAGTLLGQGAPVADVAPNENLVARGIPKIPASIAAAVASYTEFRTASLLGWHPSRREVLVTTRFADTAQIHRVRFPGGARRQLTFSPERIHGGSYPRKSGEWFVFSRDTGGSEFFQNYRFDDATGTITLLTDGRSRNSLGPWSHEGDRMAYTSTRRNGKDADLYVVDPENPAGDRLVTRVEGGGWAPLDWSPDDRTLLVSEYLSINESYLWLVDVASGEKTALTPRDVRGVSYVGGEFTADGKSVLVATDLDAEFPGLARIELETRKLIRIASPAWGVELLELSPDGKTLAFVTDEDGVGVLHLLETSTWKERPRPALPPGTVTAIHWHASSKELGFELASARSPADVYSLVLESGAVERWTESETGGIATEAFAEPELVLWKSFDGRRITGFLYKPPARFTGKRPVLISIHGGPEGQARPGFPGRNNYLLDELGVAVLYPNVRGSSGYGKTFLELDNGFLREDSVKDIGALLDWIPGRPDLDPERVAVMGGSYGGYMSLAVATNYDARIRCSIDVVGISNFVTFLEHTEAYRRDLRRAEYGDERDPKMREFLTRISPATNAAKITKPLFVVQGKNDPRVPLAEAEQMVAAVEKNGSPVWYLVAKDEGHGFGKKKNVDFQFYATVRFLEEHLLESAAKEPQGR